MFEQDAEEYLKKDGTKAEQILNVLNEISPLKITLKQLPFILATLKQTYQDAAEVGYNKAKVEVEESYKEFLCNSELNLASVTERLEEFEKANEWHYVKDGDLPKETGMLMSNNLILFVKMKGTDLTCLSLGKYNFSNNEFCYQHIVGITEVIAWKEIILPSESMRSFDKNEQKKYTEAISKVYKPTGVKLFDKEKADETE